MNKIIYFSTEDYYSINNFITDFNYLDDVNIPVNDYLIDLREQDENYIISELNQKINDNLIIAYGKIKRWNGIFSIYKIDNFNNIYSLMQQNCDDFSIYLENNDLIIHGIHHDGYINICIRILTEQGYEIYDNWQNNNILQYLTEQELINYLINNYSQLIYLDY